ncbi:hypothetical protein [Nocardiopsis alba]|uniref:hypothetical protein n=1 Tax=Nocardiopsis alba TaxID=53437 RepID=UPI000360B793|nr:hypothetical protein [Nocardiopsis alba]
MVSGRPSRVVKDPAGELAEQLVTLADGAAGRAMILNRVDYGRHGRAAADALISQALKA